MKRIILNINLLLLTILFGLQNNIHAQEECEKTVFIENDGYVVFEAENTTLNSFWKVNNSFSEDALGEGHIEFQGNNSYGSVNEETILTYKIQINTPGTYQVKWRSRNGKNAAKFDEENDSWLMVNASDFYGIKNATGQKVNSNNHFMKMWIQDINNWSWNCFGEHGGVNGLNVFAEFDVPGVYEIKVAGRSKFHPIDRIALYMAGKGGTAMANSTVVAELECEDEAFKEYAAERNYGIKQLDNSIIIDGELDDLWSYVEEQVGNYEANEEEISPHTDFNFKFKLAYDADYLYLLADVVDENLQEVYQESDRESGDAIELYFNIDNQHNDNGSYDDNDLMLRLYYGAIDGFYKYEGNWKTNTSDLKYITKSKRGGYILEAKIPWDGVLTEYSNLENLKLGFEISALDRDTNLAVENQLHWANGTGINTAIEDTRKFGTIELLEWSYLYPFKTDWEVIHVDSEDNIGVADRAIDDDMATFWHTEWRERKAPLPHEIQIDMKQEYAIEELHYYNRQDEYGPNGAIGDYEVYISNDSNEWGTPVANGTLDWGDNLTENYKVLQKIEFTEVAKGRFLKIVALSEIQNDTEVPFTAAAEFYIVTAEEEEDEINDEVTSNSLASELKMKIYPNPSADKVMINGLSNLTEYRIYDMQLKLVLEGYLPKGDNLISIRSLNKGMHLIQFKTDKGIITKKIIKK